MSGLYVHVPFCGSICSYCHFPRTADHDPDVRARYVAGVVREMDLRRERCAVLREGRRPLETAYLGGGTPSQLEPRLMAELLEGTVGKLPATADLELTAEANPESLTETLAECWVAAGVNRVSLGVQSLDAAVLRLLGRACDPVTARRGLKRACRIFPRVSAYGPGGGFKFGRPAGESCRDCFESIVGKTDHQGARTFKFAIGNQMASRWGHHRVIGNVSI